MPHLPASAALLDPELAQFSFWCGSWLVTYTDDDGRSWEGSNEVALVEGGAIVEERFSLLADGELLTGRSVSAAVPGRGWCQTWVDNSGQYLDFVGGWNGSEMCLERSTVREGASLRQRMVWYAITDSGFTWDWQSSADEGANWKLNWRLDYARRDER